MCDLLVVLKLKPFVLKRNEEKKAIQNNLHLDRANTNCDPAQRSAEIISGHRSKMRYGVINFTLIIVGRIRYCIQLHFIIFGNQFMKYDFRLEKIIPNVIKYLFLKYFELFYDWGFQRDTVAKA